MPRRRRDACPAMWSRLVAMVTLLLCGLCGAAPAGARIHGQEWTGADCPPPDMVLNGSVAPLWSDERHLADYSHITEVKFAGAVGPLGEKKMCKINCIGGEWVGPLCHDKSDSGKYHPLFLGCRLPHIPPHVVFTYRDTTVQGQNVSFPHGAVLLSRCRQLGVYKLVGASSVTCMNGAWTRSWPACVPTTTLTNFTEDSPPSILVRLPSGSASVEPSGVLAVYPGSIVHLECLYSRRLGSPEWTWTPASRQYLTGWAIAADEREWKYRLSIYYSKLQDSGTYTCSTPRGLTNRISIHVAAVHCKAVEANEPQLIVRVEGTRLGQKAIFECPTGYRLNGTANLTCRASGQWSSPAPNCVPITCPTLQLDDPHLSLVEQNASYGGRAAFSCSWGYKLSGPPGLKCELHGAWSGPVPVCEAVLCSPPLPPVNGRLVADGGHYKMGTTVNFSCNERHQLVGESTIVCTEDGFWSHPTPFCKPRCVYPGDPLHGRIAPVKFFYYPGDHLKVTCSAGYVVKLESRPVCRSDGTWSKEVPECRSYKDV